jgi:alpha-1,6-mannosyltransferase
MDENMAHYVSHTSAAMRFCRFYMKWLHFPMFDHHIVVSPHAASELRDAARGHHVRRGVWMRPMGVDSAHFRPERVDPDLRHWLRLLAGAPESGTLLVYAGRLAPEKNLQLLIETMEILERETSGAFHLLVAGNGPSRADFERECEQRVPGAIRLLGHIGDRALLADILANCDAFMHPNPHEPFGIAPLEAMASGLALVAPDSGGVTCYANHRNAWLVQPEAASFARAVQAIRGDTQEAASRRAAARITAEEFDWARVTGGFFDLYDELHELVRGVRREPIMQPAFFSTPGNRWGNEV